jgi:Protein of unknown function (DUF1566)
MPAIKMRKILFLFFYMILIVTAKAQNNYAEAISQGDDAFERGQYKVAIDKYFAAEAFDPSKKDAVKEKLRITFDKIDELRLQAIDSKKDAVDALEASQKQKRIADTALAASQKQKQIADTALAEAKKQKLIADTALTEAKKQKLIADTALAEAEKQKNKADSNFNNLQELKKTVIGAEYEGGIVFYWNDKTGKHGLIAAENDLGEFNWQQAKDTCANLSLNGYTDWRLPSDDELGSLYANRNVIGGFKLALYWSSAELNAVKAFCQSFDYGVANNYNYKSLKYRVRPVRSF